MNNGVWRVAPEESKFTCPYCGDLTYWKWGWVCHPDTLHLKIIWVYERAQHEREIKATRLIAVTAGQLKPSASSPLPHSGGDQVIPTAVAVRDGALNV